eukprot:TRINITY_DN5148_c0_g1_i1.p1 TRINITY_DN5148_c0_g1~~TRINITY_DN5148_c0_g1_i1.p1  ORF type:complete len:439 (+),score=43.62 TRINITY_DN5148_c0_g1_i1:167-1318(+)
MARKRLEAEGKGAGPTMSFDLANGAFNQFISIIEVCLTAATVNATVVIPQLRSRNNWEDDYGKLAFSAIPFDEIYDIGHLRQHWHGRIRFLEKLPENHNLTTIKVGFYASLNFSVVETMEKAKLEYENKTGEIIPSWAKVHLSWAWPPFFTWDHWGSNLLRETCSFAVNGMKPSRKLRALIKALWSDLKTRARQPEFHIPPSTEPVLVGIHLRVENDSKSFGVASPVGEYLAEVKKLLQANPKLEQNGVFYFATGKIPPHIHEEFFGGLEALIPHRRFLFKNTSLLVFNATTGNDSVSSNKTSSYPPEAVAVADAAILANTEYFIGHPLSTLSVAVHNWRIAGEMPSTMLSISPPHDGLDVFKKFNCSVPSLRPFFNLREKGG